MYCTVLYCTVLQVWGGWVLSLECTRAGDHLHQQQTFTLAPLPGEEARFQLQGEEAIDSTAMMDAIDQRLMDLIK